MGASAVGFFLAERLFEIPYRFDPWVFALGVRGGAIGVPIAGVLGAKDVLKTPPIVTLRAVQ